MATTTDRYITRKEASQLSGASATVVNKAIEQKVVPVRQLKRGTFLDARDVGALALFAELKGFALPVASKRELRRWIRQGPSTTEVRLTEALIVRRTEEVEAAMLRSQDYIGLRDRLLEVDPKVRGGEPVIRGTRIPIRGLAKQVAAGESRQALREDYPDLPDEAFEFAHMWAEANPRRGRPIPPWRGSRASSESEGREERIARRRRRAAEASTSR